jgi:Calcineurin-like phosphoesterase
MSENIIIAAGDGAGPTDDNPGAQPTVAVVQNLLTLHPNATVLILGDNAYQDGTSQEFTSFFAPTWGQSSILARTLACPGNHDYHSPGAAPYFTALGSKAGPTGKGFYSQSIAGWHVVSLNTEVDNGPGSEQITFLEQDLANRVNKPILAFFHQPRFNSGGHGDSTRPKTFWKILARERAEIILNGHAHHYERFAPQKPDQTADPQGIRQFIIGTGGRDLVGRTKNTPNSEVAEFDTFGVLKLTLEPTKYHWEFVPVAGSTFQDSGTHPINH